MMQLWIVADKYFERDHDMFNGASCNRAFEGQPEWNTVLKRVFRPCFSYPAGIEIHEADLAHYASFTPYLILTSSGFPQDIFPSGQAA